MRKWGNKEMTINICSFFNIVPLRYFDSFGITGKSITVFYRTLLNKERSHSYLDLEQCNLRVLVQSIPASSTTPSKLKKFDANQQIVFYSSA